MITRLKLSTIEQGLPKYRSMLAGNDAYIPNSFESIATATGTGSSDTITFSSIPSTYQHLQLRWIARDVSATAALESLLIRYNGVSTTSYAYHYIEANGSSVTAGGIGFSDTSWNLGNSMAKGGLASGIMAVGVIDIHDYASTTKLKTSRAFTGGDNNSTAGKVNLYSSLFNSTSAISSITIISGGSSFATTTQFALYGIKGA